MNILSKIRSFFVGETEIQDSPLELLSKAVQERDQFTQHVLKEEQVFVNVVEELSLKIEACNKAIEKGQYADEYKENLIHLNSRLENLTADYITQLADNNIKQEVLRASVVELERGLIEKAIELTILLSEEEQMFVKATLEVWSESGEIKGEEIVNQVEAIHKALELVTISDVIEKASGSIVLSKNTGPYGSSIVKYDSPVEGHYANVIVKDKDGKILFLKRAANKVVAPNQYCLPGGHIESGETIEVAAARELKEEAGLECDPGCLYVRGKAKCGDGKWAFYLDGYSKGTVMLLDGESANACWMSQEEWLESDLFFDLKEHLVSLESRSVNIKDIPTLKKAEEEELIKGGPKAQVGEIRDFGGKPHIKIHDGTNPWRPYNPATHAHLLKQRGGNGGKVQHQVVAATHVASQTMPHQVSEEDIDDFEETMERPSVEERWKAYDTFLRMVTDKIAKGLVAFGTGGVGKTFTSDSVLEEKGLRAFDEDIHKLDDDSNYDYVRITGKASPSAIYQALFEFQDKLLIFDDCDSALKQQDSINFFKGALDSSGDGTISYKAATPIKTDRVKGAKESASGDNMLVPNRFKFKGSVIFISNLSPEEMPQPLVDSRCLAIDLSMTVDETLNRMQTILPHVKIKDAQGNDLKMSMSEKQQALDFLKKYATKIRPGKINARTLLNIAKVIHSSPKNWEDTAKTLLAN